MEKFTIEFVPVKMGDEMSAAFGISQERKAEIVKLLEAIPMHDKMLMIDHLNECLKVAQNYTEAIWIAFESGINFGQMMSPPSFDDMLKQMTSDGEAGELPSFLIGKA